MFISETLMALNLTIRLLTPVSISNLSTYEASLQNDFDRFPLPKISSSQVFGKWRLFRLGNLLKHDAKMNFSENGTADKP